MRFASPSGEAVEVAKRTRLTDPQMRRVRDRAFVSMRNQGFSVEEVARFFRVSRSLVFARLAQLPEAAKRQAEAVVR